MKSFLLSEIPTFQSFRHNTSIRDTIYADRGLDGLAEFLVQQHIVQTYNDDPNALHKPLLIQLAKHHSREAIAKAVAQAWLDDAETFSLPKLSLLDKYGKKPFIALTSFTIVVPIMTWLVLHYRHDHPEIVGVFLGLEPLLALPGALASWLVYEIVVRVWK